MKPIVKEVNLAVGLVVLGSWPGSKRKTDSMPAGPARHTAYSEYGARGAGAAMAQLRARALVKWPPLGAWQCPPANMILTPASIEFELFFMVVEEGELWVVTSSEIGLVRCGLSMSLTCQCAVI